MTAEQRLKFGLPSLLFCLFMLVVFVSFGSILNSYEHNHHSSNAQQSTTARNDNGGNREGFVTHVLNPLANCSGMIYVIAWTILFYPQIILNFRTQSTRGSSPGFLAYNLLGYACYSIYTVGHRMVFDAGEHGHDPPVTPPVTIHDCIFALHAFACCCVLLGQRIVYKNNDGVGNNNDNSSNGDHNNNSNGVFSTTARKQTLKQTLSVAEQTVRNNCRMYTSAAVRGGFFVHELFVLAFLLLAILCGLLCAAGGIIPWACRSIGGSGSTFSFLSLMGYVKVVITAVKYPSQILLNMRQRSTAGLSRETFVLDFVGGSASLVQQFVLAASFASTNDGFAFLAANLPKVLVGSFVCFYDVILLFQFMLLSPPNSVLSNKFRQQLVGQKSNNTSSRMPVLGNTPRLLGNADRFKHSNNSGHNGVPRKDHSTDHHRRSRGGRPPGSSGMRTGLGYYV